MGSIRSMSVSSKQWEVFKACFLVYSFVQVERQFAVSVLE